MLFGKFEKGVEFEVGGAPFWQCVLIGDGDGDAFHAGCFGRDQPVERVFERETFERVGGQRGGAVHVHLGVRLAERKIARGGDRIKVVPDPQFVGDDLCEHQWRGGCEADAESSFAEEVKRVMNAGHGVGHGADLFEDVGVERGGGSGDRVFIGAKKSQTSSRAIRGSAGRWCDDIGSAKV